MMTVYLYQAGAVFVGSFVLAGIDDCLLEIRLPEEQWKGNLHKFLYMALGAIVVSL